MQSHCMNRKEYSEKRKSLDRLLCLPKIPSKSFSNLSRCVSFIIVSLKYSSFDIYDMIGLLILFINCIFSEKWRNTVQNMQQYFSRYFLKTNWRQEIVIFPFYFPTGQIGDPLWELAKPAQDGTLETRTPPPPSPTRRLP